MTTTMDESQTHSKAAADAKGKRRPNSSLSFMTMAVGQARLAAGWAERAKGRTAHARTPHI